MRTMMNILVILSFLTSIVVAERNITVDDFDRDRIQYFPPDDWVSTADAAITSDRYKMTTTYSKTQGSYATFNFTGATAFYFMGYGAVPTDGGPLGTIRFFFDKLLYDVPENVDLAIPQAKQILFSRKGLDVNKMYTVKIIKSSANFGGHDLNVDAMIYTVPDGSSQGSDSGGAGGNGNGNESQSGSGVSIGAIVGGVVGGVCVGVLIMVLLRWLRRRRSIQPQPQTDPLETAPYILPLHRGTTVPLGGKRAPTSRDSSVPMSSPPRPSVTSLSTHLSSLSMPLLHPSSSNAIHANPTAASSMEGGPPPYVG